MRAGKIVRICSLILIAGVFGFGIYFANRPIPLSEKVWDERTTIGSMDAENHFIIYTDIVCPYCVAFENAILENEDEFNRYIEENNVLVEIRLTDFLYEYGETKPLMSRYSAEAAYCARDEGRFWDYYKHAIKTVWDNYFKTQGKAAFTAMSMLDKSYWADLGKEIGLGESFETCVNNSNDIEEIIQNAANVAKEINGGMPSFKFNKYAFSGFDMSWGWDYVKYYFDKGLSSK